MFRFCHVISGSRLAFFSFIKTNFDDVKTPGYEELQEKKPVGWAGIRRLISEDKNGQLTPEFIGAVHMNITCIIGGVIIGIYTHGTKARIDFLENNQATGFLSSYDATRKLMDTIILASGKGAVKWGFRIGSFTTLFIGISTMIAAYNGRTSILDYTAAGAMTGGILKINFGIRGMIAGSVVGTVFGTIAGLLRYLLFFITGASMEDIEQAQFDLRKMRNDTIWMVQAKTYHEDTEKLLSGDATKSKDLLEGIKLDESNNTPISNKKESPTSQ